MANDMKITFIICTNNERWYNECVLYLSELELPDGFDADVLQITDAKSMASGYNEGMRVSDAKYKIYLHHDVLIVRKDFIKRVIAAFEAHPEVGIMGVLGTDKIVPNGSYWDHWTSGQVYALNPMQGFRMKGELTEQELMGAVALDGMILMTQYDVEWREDIFTGWDFYDVSQCFEFIKNGYKVAILHEDENSCLHDCGFSKLVNYDKNREIFCKEYAEYGFEYDGKLRMESECEKQLPKECLDKVNDLLKTDVDKAGQYVEMLSAEYSKDNTLAVLKIIFNIHFREKQAKSVARFVKRNSTWQELYEKYVEYKLLMRQIEFGIRKDAVKELYDEVKANKISLEVIEEILLHCIYNVRAVMGPLEELLEEEKKHMPGYVPKKQPKVSVLLPTYNHENFIEECIESVLNQTYKNIEFIVGDDASTDGTVEKIMKYQEQIDYIHLFEQNDMGIIMDALSYDATGEYIAIINSDDAWEPQKLEKQIELLENNPKAGACFTWCNRIDEEGNVLEEINHFNVANRTKEEWMNYFFFHGNCMAHASAVMRKDVYFKCWSPDLGRFRQLPDFYEWVQMVRDYEIIMLEEKLTRIRVVNNKNRQNVSAANRDNLIRHYTEESHIWYKEIERMSTEYFKKAFGEQMIDNQAETREEILCEKLLLLLRTRLEYCRLAAFFFFYDYYGEMRDVLSEKYGMLAKDIHNVIAKSGPNSFIK